MQQAYILSVYSHNRKPNQFVPTLPPIKAGASESHERVSMTTLAKRQAFLAKVRRLHDRCKRNLEECKQRLVRLFNTRLMTLPVRQEYWKTLARFRFLKQRSARQVAMIHLLQGEIAALEVDASIARRLQIIQAATAALDAQARADRNFVDLTAEPDD